MREPEKTSNKQLHNLYGSPDTTAAFQSRRMRGAGYEVRSGHRENA